MNLLTAYQISATAVIFMMVSLWLISLRTKDASIVDRFWGAGFVIICWVLKIFSPNYQSETSSILLSIVTIWGLRLSIYIHMRNRGHSEDYRYADMRKHHGDRFWWYSLFSVFLLQGALMLLVSAPIIFIMSQPQVQNLTIFGLIGLIFWIVGFIFEAGGDWQLSLFKRNPTNKGKLLRTGLWSLTRHPNYFGDSLQWWGFGLFAVPYGFAGLATFIGPIAMTLFIRKVSGVDLLEKSLANNKPGYADYIASTPAFLPKKFFWISLSMACLVAVIIYKLARSA